MIPSLFILPNLLGLFVKYISERKKKPMNSKSRKEYHGVEEPYYRTKELKQMGSVLRRNIGKIILSSALVLMTIFACTTFYLLNMVLRGNGNNHAQNATGSVAHISSSSAVPTSQVTSGLPCAINISAWTGGSPDWVVHNGILYNDGNNTSDNGPTIVVPCQPGLTNYAVEAKIQITNQPYMTCFGIVLRGASTQNGWQGYKTGICNQNTAYITAYGDGSPLAKAVFIPGTSEHTYRCEVKDNIIKLFIDGNLMVNATDNRLLTAQGSEQVGLFSQGVQLQVNSMQIKALT